MSAIDFEKSFHPFADLLGLEITHFEAGESTCEIKHQKKLDNTNNVVHGGVIYSIADSGMGAALMSMLDQDERCATIEIKVTYFRPAGPYDLICHSKILKKGRRVTMLESEIYSNDVLVAKASGSFAMFMQEKR